MMLHGGAVDGLDTTTDTDQMLMAADMAVGSMNSLSAITLGAEGEEIAVEQSPWTHAVVADDAAAFFDDSFVHEVSITFDNIDWYDVLVDSHTNDSADPYFAADVTIDGITMENVGVRFKGNSSFTGTGIKKSLKIDFDEFDETNDSLTYLGLKKLNLNNNYNDPTMLREKLLYDFASNFVEGASRAVHTNVTINGELYGIYTAVEQVDKTYVQTRFGSDEDGNLFKGAASDDAGDDPNADFGSDLTYLGDDPLAYEANYQLKTNETANDYSDLVELIDVLNNTSAEELADAIEPLLDVDDALASIAINNLFANIDSYNGSAHNYYLYDRDDTGQFTHILWDANESFGRFSLFVTPGEDLQELDPFWLPVATTMGGPGGGGPPVGGPPVGGPPVDGPGVGGPGDVAADAEESRPLMENLWAVAEYSDDYLRDLAEMLREGFDVTTATARINELANVIRDDVTADPNKQYTTAQFEQNLTGDIVSGMGTIYGLTSFIETRALYLDAELDSYASTSDLRLNELMTVNVATVQDESGDFDPWVEIYNFGPGLVDVSGLYLTDDAGDLTKWSIPSGSVDDGQFLTLWIDGETSEGTNHANFALDASGGILQLTDGVTVIDTVSYAAMSDDTSLARVPDGEGDFETTDQPTFGIENLASVVVVVPVEPVVLYINEFMADNDSVIEDPDEAGAFEDWVEIFNPGTQAIDLSGMSMTDDLTDPTQWQFADGSTIAAGGYLIVWADGDTDQGDNHATFKLSSGGEEIGLFHIDGTTLIDSVVFGEQVTDVSYGRFPDGSETFVAMTTPTPIATNVNANSNVGPVADAAGPYSGLVDDTITLTAAGSSDSDGFITSYAWDLDNDGQYDDATGVTATFLAASVGSFTVGVQVTDDRDAVSVDTATVTVSAVPVAAGIVVLESGGTTVVTEAGTSDVVGVSLSRQPTSNVTIAIANGDSGEISVSTHSLTFTPDNWDVTQEFTVTGVADGTVDGDQLANLTLAVSSADSAYDSLAAVEVAVTNQDTDSTPQIHARIISPDFLIRTHVVNASDVQTAILAVAHASGTITVTPIGSASVGETILILDGSLTQIGQFVDGSFEATVTAGGSYAIIFEAQTSDRLYSVSSTAGSDGFTPTAPTNFLQPTDTNGDSETSALDILLVINQLGNQPVAEGELAAGPSLMDVNGDARVSALDALVIINELSRRLIVESEGDFEPESVIPFAQWLSTDPGPNSGSIETVVPDDATIEKLGVVTSASDSDSSFRLVDEAMLEILDDGTDPNADDWQDLTYQLADDGLDLDWI
ncbi:CotH kinase family protein [Rubripirellula lacrimiformis]|nr:CotH kinase family protein [Rubripirellula lacrimiformis]